VKLIDQVRDEDDLSSFGELLRFKALIYDRDNSMEDDHEANSPFEPVSIDGDVVFPADRAEADTLFDAWVETLKGAEQQFLDEYEEEGFVALFQTTKGLMILAGSNIMGYDNPDLSALSPDTKSYLGMPHVSWERILDDVFKESAE
jgi:hypothetical protein